jgi:hypothetical protein
MDARIEWVQMTNPFGGGKPSGKKDKPAQSAVAEKLRRVLTARQADH